MRCAGDGGEERQLLSGRAPRSYTDSLIPPAALTRGGRRSEVAAGRSGCSRTRLSQPFPAARGLAAQCTVWLRVCSSPNKAKATAPSSGRSAVPRGGVEAGSCRDSLTTVGGGQ